MSTWTESTYLELQSQCSTKKTKNINIKYEDIYRNIIKIGASTKSKYKSEPSKRLLTKALNELKNKYGLIDFIDPKDGFIVKNKKQKFVAIIKEKSLKNKSKEKTISDNDSKVSEQYEKILKSKESFIYILKAIVPDNWPKIYYIGFSKNQNNKDIQKLSNSPFILNIYYLKKITSEECVNIYKYIDKTCSLKNRWVNNDELNNIKDFYTNILT